jgi:hypothetical protein
VTPAVIPDPVAALLTTCQRYRDVRERPVASNRSPEIDYWLQATGVPFGNAWCAAFVSQVGREALGAAWPVLRSASVQQIVDWAKGRGLALEERPTPGALMVLYFPAPLNRYAHIGIVAEVRADGSFTSWEGNTRVAGDAAAKGLSEREGYRVALQTRTVTSRIRFIDWTVLLQRGA